MDVQMRVVIADDDEDFLDTAHRWLFLLRSDGLLTETEKGKQGRASRYRYNGEIIQAEETSL